VTLVAQDIPKIGLVMDAVKVVRWLKKVGDTVRLGEPLVEVETEKSTVEIEARASGRLAQILVQVDQEATVGDRIAWIESDQAQSAGAAVTLTTPTPTTPTPKRATWPAPASSSSRTTFSASSRRRSSPVGGAPTCTARTSP